MEKIMKKEIADEKCKKCGVNHWKEGMDKHEEKKCTHADFLAIKKYKKGFHHFQLKRIECDLCTRGDLKGL